jgi:hypothetical protein
LVVADPADRASIAFRGEMLINACRRHLQRVFGGLEMLNEDIGLKIRGLEIDGWTLLPRVLNPEQIERIRGEAEALPLQASSYTEKQWYRHDLQFDAAPTILAAIEAPASLSFLTRLFGDEILCVSVSYSRSDPGYSGMPLHTDSHPYGSNILEWRGTSPILIRALLYLDEITEQRSPLRVVPHSHLSLHNDSIPYRRYSSHPEEVTVTCKAGDAILINQRLFHAAGPNHSEQPRSMLAISYRPAWAGPALMAPEPDPALLERMPASIRARFADPNRRIPDTTIVNWTSELPSAGIGLGPSRWQG